MEPQTTHNRFKEKILMNKTVVRNRNVLKRNSMRFAAALLAALASLVAAPNAALAAAPQHHDQAPGFYRMIAPPPHQVPAPASTRISCLPVLTSSPVTSMAI